MEFQALISSNLSGCHYDPDTSNLTIEFRGGSRYRYSAVPPDVYAELLSASSPGQYFAGNIKDVYNFTRA